VPFDNTPFPGVPAAVTPATYNRSEASTQTRTAYGWGTTPYTSWGNWCGTCHTDMHIGSRIHPVDQTLPSTITNNYNAYLMTGNLMGTPTTSFSSLVPFAEGTSTFSTLAAHALNNDTYLNGPTSGTDRILCLSCHRAHASAWEYSLRWNPENEFLTMADQNGIAVYPAYNQTGTTPNGSNLNAQQQVSRGYSVAEMTAAYYQRPANKFAPYQRQLCNKCHIQD